MERVKRLFFGRQWGAVLIVVTVLVVGGALGFANLQRAQDVPTDLIRLHVVAHSDANRDQQVKLAVRDAVLREMTPVFQAVQDVGDARRILQENLDRIAMSARVVLQDHNCPYDVRVQAEYSFPERRYGSLFLPAGDVIASGVRDGMGVIGGVLFNRYALWKRPSWAGQLSMPSLTGKRYRDGFRTGTDRWKKGARTATGLLIARPGKELAAR